MVFGWGVLFYLIIHKGEWVPCFEQTFLRIQLRPTCFLRLAVDAYVGHDWAGLAAHLLRTWEKLGFTRFHMRSGVVAAPLGLACAGGGVVVCLAQVGRPFGSGRGCYGIGFSTRLFLGQRRG